MRDPAFIELGQRVQPEWSLERAGRARRGIARKAARQRAMKIVGSIAATAAIAVIAARWTSAHDAPVARVEAPTKAAIETPVIAVRTTTATPTSADAKLEATNDRAYVLGAGSARFVVAHDEQHPFTVRAGDVLVEDVGTVFTVSYVGEDRLEVAVTEGIVRVDHDGAHATLFTGERIEVDAHAKKVAKASPTTKPAAADEVAPLLQSADDARAAGRPEDAVAPLRKIIAEHAGDSRAGLAAFTLGRVLLDELNRPKDAADAFAVARAHGGPMAADALGREVSARARAGETSRAGELADEYLRLYPRGDRAREVERFAPMH
jgi:hypothetical protein